MDFLDEKVKELERCRSARKILPKSTTKMDLFQHDIFHNQKVPVGDVRRFSRHLVAETRGAAKLSAIPTKEVKPNEKIRPTGLTGVEIHLPKVDLETDRGQEQKPKREEEVRSDAQEDMCTPPPEDDLQEQQSLHQAWQKIKTEDLDEFQKLADLAETTEELEKPKVDKSVRRRFLNWLNELIQDSIVRKIFKTYRRELEEGNEIYSYFLMVQQMTRAEREQRKREKLIRLEKRRQSVKTFLDAYWETKRSKKEALRQKEEGRYEKWAAERGLSVPDSSPQQPKKRMSKWEKRFLRVNDVFSR